MSNYINSTPDRRRRFFTQGVPILALTALAGVGLIETPMGEYITAPISSTATDVGHLITDSRLTAKPAEPVPVVSLASNDNTSEAPRYRITINQDRGGSIGAAVREFANAEGLPTDINHPESGVERGIDLDTHKISEAVNGNSNGDRNSESQPIFVSPTRPIEDPTQLHLGMQNNGDTITEG